jgi:ADP-ribose pyrophosphatase
MGWREQNETPLMAAKRELAEETGLQAKKWVGLGWFYLAPGISTQRGYIFVAERVMPSPKAKTDGEVVATSAVALGKVRTMLKNNAILDAPTRVTAQALVNYLAKPV